MLTAIRSGYDVIYKGLFFGENFLGRADFLIRDANGLHQAGLLR